MSTNRDFFVPVLMVIGGCFLIYQSLKSRSKPEEVTMSAQNAADEGIKNSSKSTTDEKIMETTNKFPVQVFVRMRPLIKEEIEAKHQEIEYNTKCIKKTNSMTLNIDDITRKKRKAIKKFKGFKGILTGEHDNYITFEKCIVPSIDNIFDGNTVCSFAYGHTGSGKTHTILGYDEKISPGIYRLTVTYICDKLIHLNKNNNLNGTDNEILISCRFADLYQGKIRDLFGNLIECHVREDDDGNINIRGETIKDQKTGQVATHRLTTIYIKQNEANKLIDKVTDSLKYRTVGSSSVHDESSRSHCYLEMELVSNKLIIARSNVFKAEAELSPVGWIKDDIAMKIEYIHRTSNKWIFSIDPETQQKIWAENKNWTPPDIDKWQQLNTKMTKVQAEFDKLQHIVNKYKDDLNIVIKNGDKCIKGSVVFVDLAGNEWGNESKSIKNDNKIQQRERKEINKSLFTLKECIRGLHSHKQHIPYRDSKLTMVLRPHLKGKNSTAIMIANISPSQIYIKKTYNTLLYSQLVAKA